MFALITFIIIFATIAYFIHVINKINKNKIPKELEGIPFISNWSTIWALLLQKNHDVIQDTIAESSRVLNINNPLYLKNFFTKIEDDDPPKINLNKGRIVGEFFGDGLIFSNGDKWRTFRKLANPAFNKALSPDIVGEITFELFNFMKQDLGRPIDIFETMQRITIEVLGKLAFGYRFGAIESVYYLIFPWLIKLPTDQNRKYFEANKEFDEFISDIIKEKRNDIENKKGSNNSRIDLLTSMLKLINQEGIHTDSKQLRDEMVGFFVAGHDTSSTALSISLYFLARYPEMQEKAREEVISILGNEPITPTMEQLKEMKYINAVIKEALRIYPPATAIVPRKLSKPMKIGPYILPAETVCSINIWQINNSPKYWENPKQYNPERFLNNENINAFSWIPFSSGVRNCIGQNFTLMEQRVILSMFLLKYKWTLPEDSIHKNKILFEPQFLLRPIDLKLVFTERNHNI
ncbi:11164_t:CDS:10 [Funneliformis geosporum]|uniref:11164_t:CDS:1 n=1 Tax=Funneliformis geosporum TaxID=1117311 RepID=A0A9W4SPX0_9GLOM|nr:11164_t:CDS:10 [Funneliformis geosporum]